MKYECSMRTYTQFQKTQRCALRNQVS
jgi:hypothetical protein